VAPVTDGEHHGAISVRPMQVEDLDELSDIDAAHAARLGVRAVLSRASVHFYQRSGHSFVAESGPTAHGGSPRAVGFALAHPSWSGADAVVRLESMAVSPKAAAESARVASSLTEAVVKSAYDAGVYRLVATVAAADDVAREALEAAMFAEEPNASYRRLLGSGGLSGGGGGEHSASTGDGRGGEHDRS